MKLENKNTFLASWIAGQISEEALKKHLQESEVAAYVELKDAIHHLEIADPDMTRNFNDIKRKIAISQTRPRQKVLRLYQIAAVAAIILIFIGLFQVFVHSKNNSTGFGELALVNFSEGSKITLNSKSQISYPTLFSYNRSIKLTGEAFFEVEKGSTFTVDTDYGCVTVLGTKFNVIARPDYFEVICFEGKVEVKTDTNHTIVSRGNAIRFYNKRFETWQQTAKMPQWTSGESTFKNAPLQFVFDQLENHYNQKILYPDAIGKTRFTGSFTHKSLTTALKSVCIPMKVTFIKQDEKIIISE